MSTALYVDPFAVEEENPPRDRWKRPLLVPAKGGERQWYTRASTMAKYLADETALEVWQRQKLAVGLARRPDLIAMIAALPPMFDAEADKKALSKTELREDKATKALLNEYIKQALEAGGASFKANHGTAVHGFTDPDACRCYVPERMQPDVDSFMTYVGTGKVEIIATEVFVVNDDLRSAGSFDHIGRVMVNGFSQLAVIDKKTGSVDGKGLSFAIQLAIYANAEVYDLDTDQRAPLESLTGGERINRRYAWVAHIPLGGGRTDFYRIDIMRGLHAARLASNVRTARSLSDLCSLVELS